MSAFSRASFFRLRFLVLALVAASPSALPSHSPAQTTSQPPQLSPEAAYSKVLEPVAITRASMANWSDSELSALAIAIAQARLECAARSPQMFRGDDLIALARLCSLSQQWSSVSAAATQYIDSAASGGDPESKDRPDSAKPLLGQAYALQIDATLQMRDEPAALAASQAVLGAVPYDTTVDQALNESLHYMQIAFMTDALTLYSAREPFLLAGLSGLHSEEPVPAASLGFPGSAKSAGPAIPTSSLYADGLAYAALQQFVGKPAEAAATVKGLDTALAAAPTPLSPDDTIAIADARRQYALLGQPLPAIPLAVSLFAEHETPRINTDYGSSTVLLLFPPWCAQCVRMGQSIMSTLFRLSDHNVHLYALLAQVPPPVPVSPEIVVHSNGAMSSAKRSRTNTAPIPTPETPKTAAELLRHTPTLIVPPATLEQFAATGFPLLIATDSKGIIRFIQPAPETALNPGDFLDQVTAHIAAQWPRPQPQR